MRRIIHTFILAFQFIILPAVFTACKDDGGNISPLQEVTPAFSWEENSFLLETDNGWGITRFSNRIALSNFSQKAPVPPLMERWFWCGRKDRRCPEDSRSRKETANHPARQTAHRRYRRNVLQYPFPKRRKNRHIAIIQIAMPEQTVYTIQRLPSSL